MTNQQWQSGKKTRMSLRVWLRRINPLRILDRIEKRKCIYYKIKDLHALQRKNILFATLVDIIHFHFSKSSYSWSFVV